MKTALAVFAGVLMILAATAPALAQRTEPPPIEIHLGVSLVTPPLLLVNTGFCQVVNVASQPRLVGVRIFDDTGAQISPGEGAETCIAGQALQPNTSCHVRTDVLFVFAHCRITVLGGKDDVRGALTVFGTNATVEAH
jgi:hypothetical protein